MAKLSGMRCLVRSLAVGVSIMSETESAWVSGKKKKKKISAFSWIYAAVYNLCL